MKMFISILVLLTSLEVSATPISKDFYNRTLSQLEELKRVTIFMDKYSLFFGNEYLRLTTMQENSAMKLYEAVLRDDQVFMDVQTPRAMDKLLCYRIKSGVTSAMEQFNTEISRSYGGYSKEERALFKECNEVKAPSRSRLLELLKTYVVSLEKEATRFQYKQNRIKIIPSSILAK